MCDFHILEYINLKVSSKTKITFSRIKMIFFFNYISDHKT